MISRAMGISELNSMLVNIDDYTTRKMTD